jgi:ribosomal protein L11 methylase PrmA
MYPSWAFVMDNETNVGQSAEQSLTELVSDQEQLRELLESSCLHGADATTTELWEAWVEQRKFIADMIDQSGSVMDYGCANGFLLKCLQSWSPHTLEPWGMDIDDEALRKAKQLFPQARNHFMTPKGFSEGTVSQKKFDFVYWNVWDDFPFDEKGIRLLNNLMKITEAGGKTILGFYDTKENNLAKIAALQAVVPMESVVVENPTGEEVVLIISKL